MSPHFTWCHWPNWCVRLIRMLSPGRRLIICITTSKAKWSRSAATKLKFSKISTWNKFVNYRSNLTAFQRQCCQQRALRYRTDGFWSGTRRTRSPVRTRHKRCSLYFRALWFHPHSANGGFPVPGSSRYQTDRWWWTFPARCSYSSRNRRFSVELFAEIRCFVRWGCCSVWCPGEPDPSCGCGPLRRPFEITMNIRQASNLGTGHWWNPTVKSRTIQKSKS